jgi:hypothetical protein
MLQFPFSHRLREKINLTSRRQGGSYVLHNKKCLTKKKKSYWACESVGRLPDLVLDRDDIILLFSWNVTVTF